MQVLFQPEQNIFPPPGAPPPQAKWNLKTQLYENDVLLLEWTADSAKTKVDDGIDTFIFKDGFIRVQIVRYTLQRK
jgi:hypothetical protein